MKAAQKIYSSYSPQDKVDAIFRGAALAASAARIPLARMAGIGLAARAFDDQCTSANPRFPLIEEIVQLYLDAYEGRRQPL